MKNFLWVIPLSCLLSILIYFGYKKFHSDEPINLEDSSYVKIRRQIFDLQNSLDARNLELQDQNLELKKIILDLDSKISKSDNKINNLKLKNEKYKVFIDSLPVPD